MAEVINTIENATVSKRTFFQRVFVIQHFLIIAGVGVLVLTILSRIFPYFQFDLSITRAIQGINVPGFSTLMVQLTNLGNTIPAGIVIASVSGILFAIDKRTEALTTIISSLGLSGVGLVFKALVARPRPDSLLINQLGQFVKPDSFPSGHVLQFMGLYGFLFIFIFIKFKKSNFRSILLVILLILLVGIGLSRIYVGAHWFSDTLGSYLLGFIWLYYITNFYNKYEKKDPEK